jgi:CheY-like chemotaxis protein
MYFPRSYEEQEKETEVELDLLKGEREKVLIVDDEEAQREVAQKLLQALNYEADVVASGEEAIELVKQEKYDIIVLDMLMGEGLNGRQTYEAILQIHPKQKAIIASGFSHNEEVQKAQELGAGSYIRKPYTLRQIASAMKKSLNTQR